MERLTKKISKTVQDKYSLGSYLQYDFANADDINKLLNKLGKFEDFMERNDLQELEQLQEIIERDKFNYLITAPLEQENQTLKGNWAKLREFVGHERICVDDGFQEVYDAYGCVLEKMQELEGGDGRKR